MFYLFEGFPSKVKTRIVEAIKRINDLKIVKLQEVVEGNYPSTGQSLFVYKKYGCSSHVGWSKNKHSKSGGGLIKISDECSTGVIVHELLHALGLEHEQVNPKGKFEINFTRIYMGEAQYVLEDAIVLTEHDPNSIMHYSSTDNTICHFPDDSLWETLDTEELPSRSCRRAGWKFNPITGPIDCRLECATFIDPEVGLIKGQREELSKLDIEGLRVLYPKL